MHCHIIVLADKNVAQKSCDNLRDPNMVSELEDVIGNEPIVDFIMRQQEYDYILDFSSDEDRMSLDY
ncbi:hypothetical protein ABEB36_007873 [Hypothenemus hampei]|uniref:Uncharacterized protein n=1 Tax=Hypothenemus hampei TaxID=57062 RepID=A0ABD1EVY0_HYPHA